MQCCKLFKLRNFHTVKQVEHAIFEEEEEKIEEKGDEKEEE